MGTIDSSILVLFTLLLGGYLLLTKDNKFSEQMAKYETYSPEEISSFLGWGLIAIGISCIPSWIADEADIPWLNWVTVGLIVLSLIAIRIKYNKDHKKDKDQNE